MHEDRFDAINAAIEAEIVRRHVAGTTAEGICTDLRAEGIALLDLWQVHDTLASNGRHENGHDEAGKGGAR
jgi:hypothetical protein